MIDMNEPAAVQPVPQISATPLASIGFVDARRAIELALRLGDARIAAQAARHLRELFPDAIAPQIFLGQALLELGDPSAAIAHFRAALIANPLASEAWIGLAGALSLDGQTDAAAAALRSAALHDPLDSELLTPGIAVPPDDSLGVAYLRRGYAGLAAAELSAALQRHADRQELRLYSIEALRRDGDLATARALLAELEPYTAASLPVLLLHAALDSTEPDGLSTRQQCARLDIDGQMTRRFFAPEHPPWKLAPAPVLSWSAAFQPLADYLAHAPIGKAAHAKSSAVPRLPAEPDADARAFIATAEHVRQRIAEISGAPAPLAPWTSIGQQRQLLLGSKRTLQQRYGEAGFGAIDRRLRILADALSRRGIATECCYFDDPASLQIDDQLALAPVAREAGPIRDLIRTLADVFEQRRQQLGTTLLIGGDDSIPFHRLPNPLHDDDPLICSDTPYGSDDAGYLLPHRVVARLPDGAGADPDLLLTLLDQMIDYHSGGGAYQKRSGLRLGLLGGRRAPTPASECGLKAGYSAEIWQAAARAVLDALDPSAPLTTSPPLDADGLAEHPWIDERVLYVNLHGATGLPNWYGQPEADWPGAATRLPIALRPDQLGARRAVGGLLISEACYGAEILDRGPESSIPLRALAEGMLACVGATASSYASLAAPLLGADLLCQRLLARLATGASVGEALHQARLEFAQTMYRRQGYLDDVDVKTLMEFILLGDPWAAIDPRAPTRASWSISKVAGIERIPKPRPKFVIEETRVPRELLKRVRHALRQVLPGATTVALHVVAQPNLRFTRKGDSEQELTFSASDQQLTIDGHQIARTAHVTVSGQAVVKIALTR
ncbi:MAG TPA: tetratricopeptide repeat protein [Roseiflexaceae bacterium]|nr:tetratricopeptide repeat protein [Roseiflexaceae bacterium]